MEWNIIVPLAIVVLVGMLTLIGAQLFLILKEFQKTVQKFNKVLDDGGTISESISKPMSMLSDTVMGIKGGATVLKMFRGKGKKTDD